MSIFFNDKIMEVIKIKTQTTTKKPQTTVIFSKPELNDRAERQLRKTKSKNRHKISQFSYNSLGYNRAERFF